MFVNYFTASYEDFHLPGPALLAVSRLGDPPSRGLGRPRAPTIRA